jgi:hypothetical protein
MTANGNYHSNLRATSRRSSGLAPITYYYGYFTAWAETV